MLELPRLDQTRVSSSGVTPMNESAFPASTRSFSPSPSASVTSQRLVSEGGSVASSEGQGKAGPVSGSPPAPALAAGSPPAPASAGAPPVEPSPAAPPSPPPESPMAAVPPPWGRAPGPPESAVEPPRPPLGTGGGGRSSLSPQEAITPKPATIASAKRVIASL